MTDKKFIPDINPEKILQSFSNQEWFYNSKDIIKPINVLLYQNFNFCFMGQSNLEKISENTIDLKQDDDISEVNADQFLKSYESRRQQHGDLEKFISEPSMELFLKHFINYEYPRTNEEGNKLFSSENLPNFGKEQWNEMIKENLENDIKKIGKDVEKKMDYLVQEIKSLFLTKLDSQIIKKKTKEIVCQILDVDDYEIYFTEKKSKCEHLFLSKDLTFCQVMQTINSKILSKGTNISNKKQQNNFQSITDKAARKIFLKQQSQRFNFQTETQTGYISLNRVKQNQSDFFQPETIKKEKLLMEKICEIMIEVLRIVFKKKQQRNNAKTSYFETIKSFSSHSFSLLQLQLKKMKIYERLRLQKLISKVVDKDFLLVSMQSNIANDCENLFGSFLERIRKYKKQISKDHHLYLQFNKSGNMRLLLSSKNNKVVLKKLSQSLVCNYSNVLSIFQENRKLNKILNKASRGLIESSKIQINNMLLVEFVKNKKGGIQEFSISINMINEESVLKIFGIKEKEMELSISISHKNEKDKNKLPNKQVRKGQDDKTGRKTNEKNRIAGLTKLKTVKVTENKVVSIVKKNKKVL